MKPLVVIPARGGSKGIPGKNIKLLNGIPLINYTVSAAMELFDNEVICVSTDEMSIKICVEEQGIDVPFLRPSVLGLDTTPTYDVLMHALKYYEAKDYHPDVVILLQPTSPFRNSLHIREALQLYNDSLDMVVSVKETRSNPYYVLFEEDADGYLKKSKQANFSRRQDCPKVWEYNGAIYIINTSSLKQKSVQEFEKVFKYEMSESASIDLDTPLDWDVAEMIVKKSLI
ncbi:MAG: acylneuraminate cytidylyltransferase family protein [Flavobacterium sp.]|nr:MAG: acylneuraminate cytidylyltransferase family protein [Flavobacterium sp.]